MKKPNHNLIYEYRLPYGPFCSPAGRFAAYGVKQAVQEANRYSLQIHVLDLKTGEDQILNKTWNCPFYFWTCQEELLLGKKEGGETAFMKWAPGTEEVTFSFRIHGNCVGAKPLRSLEDGLENGLKSGQTSAGGEEILLLIRENVNPIGLHKKVRAVRQIQLPLTHRGRIPPTHRRRIPLALLPRIPLTHQSRIPPTHRRRIPLALLPRIPLTHQSQIPPPHTPSSTSFLTGQTGQVLLWEYETACTCTRRPQALSSGSAGKQMM